MRIRYIATAMCFFALFLFGTKCNKEGAESDQNNEPAKKQQAASPESRDGSDQTSSTDEESSQSADNDSEPEKTPHEADGGQLDRDTVSTCVKKCVQNNKMRSVPMPQIRSDCEQKCAGMTD